jgi:addiction module RelE/StbE family toxin
MKVEWSEDALADLDRFASFLQQQHPFLAKLVANELIDKVQLLSDHPQLGRLVKGRTEYRQLVIRVLNAAYIVQYRFDGKRLIVLRVLHGRERR